MAAVKAREKDTKAIEAVGQAAAAENMAHVEKLMVTFKSSLEEFAAKHKKSINQDPAFRQQFQTMCVSIGVDPLASSKGFWSILDVGDFYYELSVQITDICLSTRATNGGLIALQELLDRLRAKRNRRKAQAISADDVRRAISKLKVLGSGFAVVEVGRTPMVLSVPRELSNDATAVLQLAESGDGFTSVSAAQQKLGWDEIRARRVLHGLLQDEMAWIDREGSEEELFWFPSLWKGENYLGPSVEEVVDA